MARSHSSALNLDLTVNSDFSQVEMDKQVTNLTRFNIFFRNAEPFPENNDLFSMYGIDPIRPFFRERLDWTKMAHDSNHRRRPTH